MAGWKKWGWKEGNLQVIAAQVTHRLSSPLLTLFCKMWQKKHCKAKEQRDEHGACQTTKIKRGISSISRLICQSAISFSKLEVKWAHRNFTVTGRCKGWNGKENRDIYLWKIHPSKRAQGGKEDRRIICKETFLDCNESTLYRTEKIKKKKKDSSGFYILSERRRHLGQQLQMINSRSFQIKQKGYQVEMRGTNEAIEKLFNLRQKRIQLHFGQKKLEEDKLTLRNGGQLMSSFSEFDCIPTCTHRQQFWSSFKTHYKSSSNPCYYLSELAFPRGI